MSPPIPVKGRDGTRQTSSNWPFSRSPWTRFNDAASSRLMTSRSVAVPACPAAKFSPYPNRSAKRKHDQIAGNLPIGLPAVPGGLPTNIPTGVGVGASGTIYFSSDIENAIYKVAKK